MGRPRLEGKEGYDAAVRRFWYEAYACERGHELPGADHVRREVHDPMAEQGNLIVARGEGGTVRGTVLTTYANQGDLGFYVDYFGLEPGNPHQSMTTRLVVAPSERRTRLSFELALTAYNQALIDGIQQDFVDCQHRHLAYFTRLGYRRLGPDKVHPLYGPSALLVLDPWDRAHLEAVGSPLVRVLDRMAVRAAS